MLAVFPAAIVKATNKWILTVAFFVRFEDCTILRSLFLAVYSLGLRHLPFVAPLCIPFLDSWLGTGKVSSLGALELGL